MTRRLQVALLAFAIAAIAWGALAFGAVYPWAFTPLAICCASVGGLALLVQRGRPPKVGGLSIGLAVVALTVALQLVPLSRPVLTSVSPNTEAFLRAYDFSYSLLLTDDGIQSVRAERPQELRHPISISPEKTALGLMLFAAFAVFLLGASRLVSAVGAESVIKPLVALGIVLALFGIVQDTVATPTVRQQLIYGFWRPQFQTRPFGPFVNPNHFAGWMLMTIPLALAGFYERLLRVLGSSAWAAGNRRQLFASSDAGRLLVFGVAASVMGLSLLMTRSRSGVGAFVGGSALAAWAVTRRQKTTRGRALVAVSFLLLLSGTAAWAGFETVTGKFVQASQGISTVGGRVDAWKDTLDIIRRFPLAGTGLDTYGVAMVLYQTRSMTVHFREAHNDYLQLAAEGGVLVCVPLIAVVAIFVRDVRRRFREAPKEGTTYWLRTGAVVGMVSVALQALVEFSLQMPGNAALFALLAAIALHRSPNLRREPRHAVV